MHPLEFAATGSGSLMILIYVALFAAFYFFLIRPQSKRQKEKKQMVESLKEGDRVVTVGGLYGVVTSVKDSTFSLRIAPKVEVVVARSALSNIEGKVSRDDLKQSRQELKKVPPPKEEPPAGDEDNEATEPKA